jgi:hypothetical protein
MASKIAEKIYWIAGGNWRDEKGSPSRMGRRAFLAGVLALAAGLYLLRPRQERILPGAAPPSGADELDFIYANLVGGGPPKDGIPAIDHPVYLPAEEGDGFLKEEDVVFGVTEEGAPRAYPQKVFYWHEIVNEEREGKKLSLTYCPLTGSVIGFRGSNFGVSGKLYNSNLVMYDRETESLWPQILGKAVHGARKGERLESFPAVVTTWGRWKARYPETLVLSEETGYRRNYNRNPYPGYEELLRVWFPVAAESDRFHTKKVMVGIENRGEYLAIPKEEFRGVGRARVSLGGDGLEITYDLELESVEVTSAGGEVRYFEVYWFAWYAYHPETGVWSEVEGTL